MLLSCIATLATLAAAAPTRELKSPYVPVSTKCPTSSLVREATGLNAKEAAYVEKRKCAADASLAAWLEKQGAFCATSLPLVGLANSGGGQRALLESAGIVRAFDGRDGDESVGGIFQALTYHSGLSGGAWFLSSLAGNNWPTVSYLQEKLWNEGFQETLLDPKNALSATGLSAYSTIVAETEAKEAAGFDTTIVDPWGRLISYALLEGKDGGVSKRLSDVVAYGNFTSHTAPFPIMTGISVNASTNDCSQPTDAAQYEFTPFEYGSWDAGIAAFADTKYMGTSLSAGIAKDASDCIVKYDNLAYILGASSDIWVGFCEVPTPSNATLIGLMSDIVTRADNDTQFEDLTALFPNPFYNLPTSPDVAAEETLTLFDGGLSGQVVPIWPFIQDNARAVDVLIANDNSADTEFNWPNGTSLRQTYLSAVEAGLTRMPFIPTPEVFVAEGLDTRASFFGCNETDTMFIVHLPNAEYVYPSNQSTSKLAYTVEETTGMIDNGIAIATQNGTEGWPFCLACGIMNRAENLPEGCADCFARYCYRQ